MAQKSAPLFRKAGRGYNKEDVNKYIICLNKNLEETKNFYEKALNDCNTRAASDYEKL